MGCFGASKPQLLVVDCASLTQEPELNATTAASIIDARSALIRQVFDSVGKDQGWRKYATLPFSGQVEGSVELYEGYAEGAEGPFVVAHATIGGSVGSSIEPDALFRWIVSVEGFKVIDPDTKNHEAPPVEVYTKTAWRDRAEAIYAVAPPLMALVHARTFMVLNAMDHAARLFISTPTSHAAHPKAKEPSLKQVRARNVWGTLVEPRADGQPGCVMKSLCWTTLGGSFPQFLTDKFMLDQYMQLFHGRFYKALSEGAVTKPLPAPAVSAPANQQQETVSDNAVKVSV